MANLFMSKKTKKFDKSASPAGEKKKTPKNADIMKQNIVFPLDPPAKIVYNDNVDESYLYRQRIKVTK
jgi:hypothetical protein